MPDFDKIDALVKNANTLADDTDKVIDDTNLFIFWTDIEHQITEFYKTTSV